MFIVKKLKTPNSIMQQWIGIILTVIVESAAGSPFLQSQMTLTQRQLKYVCLYGVSYFFFVSVKLLLITDNCSQNTDRLIYLWISQLWTVTNTNSNTYYMIQCEWAYWHYFDEFIYQLNAGKLSPNYIVFRRWLFYV